MFKLILRAAIVFFISSLAQAAEYTELYSRAADEYTVRFEAVLKTEFKSVEQVKKFTLLQKQDVEEYLLRPTIKYMFGPLTNRSLGGEQKGSVVIIHWDKATLVNGTVLLSYDYQGQWLINKRVNPSTGLKLPLPYSYKQLRTNKWRSCTDESPEHQDFASFWYYWDPERNGCDHELNVQYQEIYPKLSSLTQQTSVSYPEYQNMIVDNKIKMTFAFGYVEDPANPNPYTDSDYGMGQFRSFIDLVKRDLRGSKFAEEAILENQYLGAVNSNRRIGTKINFVRRGLEYEIKIVAAADIDQMELFAQSFSADHDSFFGWFGHSRVGNGFDASKFNSMLASNKKYYSLTPNYQIIYWAGCNSYSYYTKPFFDFKANLIDQDPIGSKSLDIISNGLPSYFSLNAVNAEVLFQSLLFVEKQYSYQDIVSQLERQSNAAGITVLVNVLGDEDNSLKK